MSLVKFKTVYNDDSSLGIIGTYEEESGFKWQLSALKSEGKNDFYKLFSIKRRC